MTDKPKPHTAAVEAAQEIVVKLGRSRERILPVARQITDAYGPLVKACQLQHGGKHNEPGCPICIALRGVVGEEVRDADG